VTGLLAAAFAGEQMLLLDSAGKVDHDDQVIAQARHVGVLLADRGSALDRSFAAGETSQPADGDQGERRVTAALGVLGRLVADNSAQEARRQQLRQLDRQLAELVAAEERLRDERSRHTHQLARAVVGGSLLAALLLGGMLGLFARRLLRDREQTLIDDLLSLARVTRAEMHRSSVDLAQIARAVVEELRRREPGRVVEVAIVDTAPASGDARLLRAALENLFDNSWKFTGKTVAARIELGVQDRGGDKTFYVRDNGAGFDMSYAHKLFTPFQRLHEQSEFEGTGIGLATVQRIITRHGGKLWAESTPGQGATFWFTLGAA
jgi:signal transduction histidine kinase